MRTILRMIFAERIYDVNDGSQIRLKLWEPVKSDDDYWYCRVQIDWPSGRTTDERVHGLDKLEALLRGVALARMSLTKGAEARPGLAWQEASGLRLDAPSFD